MGTAAQQAALSLSEFRLSGFYGSLKALGRGNLQVVFSSFVSWRLSERYFPASSSLPRLAGLPPPIKNSQAYLGRPLPLFSFFSADLLGFLVECFKERQKEQSQMFLGA